MLYFFALKDAPVFYKHSVGEMRTTKIDLRFEIPEISVYTWEECHDYRQFRYEQIDLDTACSTSFKKLEERRIFRPCSDTEYTEVYRLAKRLNTINRKR